MSRTFIIIAAAITVAAAVVLGALSWWSRSADRDLEDVPVAPEGRWHLTRPSRAVSESEDEMARVLSLPYLSGREEAGSQSGVLVHDETRSWPGVNLYVSGHGPEAILLDTGGRVLHRWRLPYEAAFGTARASESTMYWRRARLLPDGSLLAIFQAGGMVKVDAESNLVWALDEGFYNDLEVLPDGTILAIGKAARMIPEINRDELVLEDSIVKVSPDGEILDRLSLLRVFQESLYADLLEPMAAQGDIFHSNTVTWLDGSQVEASELFKRGNVLVSLREVDIVAIVDPARALVEWAARGPWDAQHQPELLDTGEILLFDNKGAGGLSRVIELDPLTMEIGWQYPAAGAAGKRLSSPEAGSSQRLPSGTTLITESERGRAIEVTREGEIVWEFLSPHRAGPERSLVATLFEVERLPASAASFLDGGLSR